MSVGGFFFRVFRFNSRPVRDGTQVQKRRAGDVSRGIGDQSRRDVRHVSGGHRDCTKTTEDCPPRVSLQIETVPWPSPEHLEIGVTDGRLPTVQCRMHGYVDGNLRPDRGEWTFFSESCL